MSLQLACKRDQYYPLLGIMWKCATQYKLTCWTFWGRHVPSWLELIPLWACIHHFVPRVLGKSSIRGLADYLTYQLKIPHHMILYKGHWFSGMHHKNTTLSSGFWKSEMKAWACPVFWGLCPWLQRTTFLPSCSILSIFRLLVTLGGGWNFLFL